MYSVKTVNGKVFGNMSLVSAVSKLGKVAVAVVRRVDGKVVR